LENQKNSGRTIPRLCWVMVRRNVMTKRGYESHTQAHHKEEKHKMDSRKEIMQ